MAVQSSRPSGSSPRWRGALRRLPAGRLPGRIIPALAGSTRAGRTCGRRFRDHPRAGGVHTGGPALRTAVSGSSPGWRVAQLTAQLIGGGAGIIPALAGSTPARRQPPPASRDHPRAGGEHSPSSRSPSACLGSSPRWRGALVVDGVVLVAQRIIPALAGSTSSKGRAHSRPSDHPRAGGEHTVPTMLCTVEVGSSPRWRGAPGALLECAAHDRIIPALAGSTPHARSARWAGKGSSPRWRGAP